MFNHLNVPNQYKHYWTKYPEGYTILEALLNWVNQVDSMVDNQNDLNKTVEQFGSRLDEFISRFDDRLQDEVEATLQEWQASGFLEVIINEALQTQMDEVDRRLSAVKSDKSDVLEGIYSRRTTIAREASDLGLSTTPLDNAIRSFNDIYENKVIKKFGVDTGSKYVKAVWLWQADTINTSSDEVLDVLEKTYINRVYVTYDRQKTPDSKYAYFIEEANKRGIVVEALYGDPHWGLETHRDTATGKVQSVIDYNTFVPDNQKFHGVHIDVEPYVLDEWDISIEEKTSILKQWYDGAKIWTDLGKSGGLFMSTSIPFWTDTSADVIAAQPPEFVRPFYQMYIDLFDHVALMAYRDDATRVLSLVENELAYVPSDKILVGIETTNQNDDLISYYEEGYEAFDLGSRYLHTVLAHRKGYGGIAIHDYRQLKLWFDVFTHDIEEDYTDEDLGLLISLFTDVQSEMVKLEDQYNTTRFIEKINGYTKTETDSTFIKTDAGENYQTIKGFTLTVDSGPVASITKFKNANGQLGITSVGTTNSFQSTDVTGTAPRDLTIEGAGGLTLANAKIRAAKTTFTGLINISQGGTPPATPTSPGEKGDVIYTETHLYICTAPNSWKRTELFTW
jgi:hypothetical protein